LGWFTFSTSSEPLRGTKFRHISQNIDYEFYIVDVI